jgi:chemotaxis protein MotA
MDIATIIGLVLGLGAILGGAVLEGLHFGSLIQPTAALIVLGGTFGAAFISFPMDSAVQAVKDLKMLFVNPQKPDDLIPIILELANRARKNGILSLEEDSKNSKDLFLRKALTLCVDGVEPKDTQDILEIELATYEEHAKMSAEFYEAAGGYAPTIGIIGAVLGLIHVMSNLSDTSKLGAGIAVAFVATIYGLVTANIICLPFASKIKMRIKSELQRREMLLAGILGIQQGSNPRFIEERLKSFLHGGGEHSNPEGDKGQ